MMSTTTEEESDLSPVAPKRKHCRQRMISSSSSESDESVIVRTRRRRCRVTSSSSDSDSSVFARPAEKKRKVIIESESDSTETSESENERLQRRQDARNKRAVLSDTEVTSGEGVSSSKKSPNQANAYSSDSDGGEPCIICFKTLRPPFARPSNCVHNFHPICLSTWSKTSNTCPIDRVVYTAIHVVDFKGELISQEAVSTPPPQDHNADFEPDDATFCEICSQHDREHEMLLCDRCDAGYHLDCLNPPLREVPEGNWYCRRCSELDLELAEEMAELMDDAAVILENRMRQRPHSHARMPRGAHPRTQGAQRVFNIIHSRDAAGQPSTSSEITVSSSSRCPTSSHRRLPSSTASRRRTTSSTASRRRTTSSRRSQSTRYKVELVTVEDGTTLEVKVAVNTRTRRKSRKHSRRKSKKKCYRSSRRSGESSRSAESSLMAEGPSHSLDLFGTRPQLDYFSGCEAEDELDEDKAGRSDLAALRRGSQPVVRNMASRKQIAARVLSSSSRRTTPKIEQSSAPVDLVSSILEQQEKWHSRHASYESTSNGDIRVVLKDSSRRNGGSSGSSRAESSRSQPSSSGASRPGPSGCSTSRVSSSSSKRSTH